MGRLKAHTILFDTHNEDEPPENCTSIYSIERRYEQQLQFIFLGVQRRELGTLHPQHHILHTQIYVRAETGR